MVTIATLFEKKLDEVIIGMYFEQLKEFEYADIKNAFTQRHRFWPKPFDISEIIQGSESEKKQTLEIQANKAADLVLEILRIDGAMAKPELFVDKIIANLMTTRWPWHRWACELTGDDMKWWRKEFIVAYVQIALIGIDNYKQISHGEAKQLLGRVK